MQVDQAVSGEDEGKEPDYRFSLANERTFLAWMRTALALLAGGALLHQFAGQVGPQWLRLAVSVGLVLTAGALAAGGLRQWHENQIAMRHGRPLPSSPLIPALSVAVVLLAAGTVGLLILQ